MWTRCESNLRRNEDGYFEDNDLAELVFDAIEAKAGCPGGKAVPDWAREREILKFKQARQAKVCTLNEFRQHLGLKRAFASIHSSLLIPTSLLKALQSFEEWNPELATTARDIYNDINQLELYVRLPGYRLMVLTLTLLSLAFCVKHRTVVASDLVIQWYNERLLIVYLLTPATFADMGADSWHR